MENCANPYRCRAYFLVCPFHKNRKKKKILANNKARKKLQEMGVEIFLTSDFKGLAEEIENFDFGEYASLLIFAEFMCYHYKTDIDYPLEPVYKAIQKNYTLKNVTKLVMCFSLLQVTIEWTEMTEESDESDENSTFDNNKMPPDIYIPFYDLMDPKFGHNSPIVIKSDINTSIYVKPKNNKMEKYTKNSTDFENLSLTEIIKAFGKGTEINMQIHPKKEHFLDDLQVSEQQNIPNIDNFTFIQCLQKEFSTTRTFVNMIYDYLMNYAYEKPVQEIAQLFCTDICSERYSDQAFYNTTCAGAGYVFHMNPALTFILNQLTFPQQEHLTKRTYSEMDIPVLQKTFMKKKIKCYTLQDGSLEDILALMEKIRTANFTWLKYLYIFISSHGDIGDIIYTKTGTYSIQDDIVKSLLANKTLKDVQKFVLVNACRGDIDPREYLDAEEIKKLMKKNNDKEKLEYFHDEKLMIMYSTQKGFVSLLYPEGAIFLQIFCEVFEENFDETSMEIIGEKIINRMNEIIYYDQVPDLGYNNNSQHSIKMEFVNSIINRKALKNMARFFRKKFQQNNDILDVRKVQCNEK